MRRLPWLMLASLAVAGLAGPVRAQQQQQQQQQQPNFTGAWSFQIPTPQGVPIASTVFLRPDGGYVRADRLPSGMMMRQWGRYNAQQIGPNAFQISVQFEGYLPHVSCMVTPGVGQNCQQVQPPPNISTVITLTSPTTLMDEGLQWQRDPSGGLLTVAVPDTSVIANAAPVQPNMVQPVMPQVTPYTTPNGPGHQMAEQFHQQNQVWTDTHLRGCSIDQYGRRYGCQQ